MFLTSDNRKYKNRIKLFSSCMTAHTDQLVLLAELWRTTISPGGTVLPVTKLIGSNLVDRVI